MLLFKLPEKDILERLENNVMHRNVLFFTVEWSALLFPPPTSELHVSNKATKTKL